MSSKTIDNAINKLPPLREVIQNYSLKTNPRLGQHFIHDLNLTKRIAKSAGNLKDYDILEIGPGPGGLTRALLMGGARRVIAVERDPRCVDALTDLITLSDGRLKVIECDALTFQPSDFVTAQCKIVANLPYNISTLLLTKWLFQASLFRSMTLMFQKEVARRLIAKSGKSYGRLSIITQLVCDVRHEFDIDQKAFNPPPSVQSSVVTLTPHHSIPTNLEIKNIETVTKSAFGQRRKMLKTSLKKIGIDPMKVHINPNLRAADLSIEQFCQLASLLE